MLKLSDLVQDLDRLAAEAVRREQDRARRRDLARAALGTHASRWEWLAARAEAARTSWLVPGFDEPPDRVYEVAQPPEHHTVVAADGSQIFPDRHGAAACFVLNLGRVRLTYGPEPSAWLDAEPRLYFREEEVEHAEFGHRGALAAEEVGILRTVLEAETLLELARDVGAGPAVALLDGSLIPWSWAREGDPWREAMLERYFAALEGFAAAGVPVASYLSRSAATDVAHLVRIGDCDQEPVNCDRCPHLAAIRADLGPSWSTAVEVERLPCGNPTGLSDGELVAGLLPLWGRSASFGTRSRVYNDHPSHRAWFWYLRTPDEVARVETPPWVARDPALAARVHAVVADQVLKGRGYPAALSEAHEQAVIRGPERQGFELLLERALVRGGARVQRSAKGRSKLRPGV